MVATTKPSIKKYEIFQEFTDLRLLAGLQKILKFCQ